MGGTSANIADVDHLTTESLKGLQKHFGIEEVVRGYCGAEDILQLECEFRYVRMRFRALF